MLPLNAPACPQHKILDGAKLFVHTIGTMSVQCEDCLEYTNMCMTILLPDTSQSREANQQAVFQNSPYLVKDLTLEEHYLFMRRLESLAANVGVLYQQRIHKERVPDIKRAEASIDYAASIKKQKDSQRPKKEQKLLSDRDKAIGALTKLGLDPEVAAKTVDKQMSKEGRAIK